MRTQHTLQSVVKAIANAVAKAIFSVRVAYFLCSILAKEFVGPLAAGCLLPMFISWTIVWISIVFPIPYARNVGIAAVSVCLLSISIFFVGIFYELVIKALLNAASAKDEGRTLRADVDRMPIQVLTLQDFERLDLDFLLKHKPQKKKTVDKIEQARRHAYLLIADINPGLALAGLRMEIEECLLTMAKKKSIPVAREGVGDLLFLLRQNQLFSQEEYKQLNAVRALLDPVIHKRVQVDRRVADWLINVSRELLEALDGKLDSLN